MAHVFQHAHHEDVAAFDLLLHRPEVRRDVGHRADPTDAFSTAALASLDHHGEVNAAAYRLALLDGAHVRLLVNGRRNVDGARGHLNAGPGPRHTRDTVALSDDGGCNLVAKREHRCFARA